MKKLIYVPVREALKSAVHQSYISTNCLFRLYTVQAWFLFTPQILCSSQEKSEFEKIILTEGFFYVPGLSVVKKKICLLGRKRVKMLEVVEASGFSFGEGNRILVCGAGRLIRHLKKSF